MTAGTAEASGPACIIGIGASAGGVEALSALVAHLPGALRAAVLVVLHVPATGTSVLPQILDRAGPLPADAARDGEPLRPGRIYVAPPDRHMVVEDGLLRLTVGPRQNGHRPAIDPTFLSIAEQGPRAVGVILSGTRDDGARGMVAIDRAGGTTFVQSPDEALFDGMICSTQEYVDVDGVLPVAELAARLADVSEQLTAGAPLSTIDISEMAETTDPSQDRTATRYTCPDCGGALWRHREGEALSFKCSVGHAYSPESFDDEQGREIENALWAAARLLGDRLTLLQEMAERAEGHGHDRSARAFREQASEVDAAAATIRRLVEGGRLPLTAVTPTEPRG